MKPKDSEAVSLISHRRQGGHDMKTNTGNGCSKPDAEKQLGWMKLFSCLFLISMMSLQQACASPKRVPSLPTQKPVVLSSTTIVSFGVNPGAAVPERKPVTPDEWVMCGLFEYDHGNFSEAANAFSEAARATLNPSSSFGREVLMAQAVCHLRDSNDIDFVRVMETLLSSYNRWELTQARTRDSRLRILEELYHQRSKHLQK